jgi:hypothetical protein
MKEVCLADKPHPYTDAFVPEMSTPDPYNDPVMASYKFMIDFYCCWFLDNLILRIKLSLGMLESWH